MEIGMTKGYVHSLESFGSVDGPGVRYIVFLSGCAMRCQFCHNPDTWNLFGTDVHFSHILNQYESVRIFCKSGITLTGGEPLLQAPEIIELFKECKKRNIELFKCYCK